VPAARLAYSRWREVEVHHVDLGLGYEPARWPGRLVELMLPDLLAGLPERAGRTALAARALDRSPAPRQDSNLRTRLRRPVSTEVSTVLRVLWVRSHDQRRRWGSLPALVRPTNRPTAGLSR